ncbi:MAG: GAF domain-containing protein [Odoribacter sp.]
MPNNNSDFTFAAKLISDVLIHLNISLTSGQDFAKSITTSLQCIGEFTRHDRMNVIEINHNMTYTILYEWYDPLLSPVPDQWKHQHLFYDSPLEEQLCNQNYIIIRQTDQTIHPNIKISLEEQCCQQMLLLPLFESNLQFAFLVFMQCQQIHDWDTEEIKLLKNISSIIATQLNNYRLVKRLVLHLKRCREKKI